MVLAKAKKSPAQLVSEVEVARSEDYRLIYADGVRITVGGYDVKLTLSVNEKMLDGKTMVTDQATIVLSPQHAKDLAVKLTDQVAAFEKDIMPLNFTEKFAKRQADQRKLIEKMINDGG